MKRKSGKQAMTRGGTALVKYQRLESLGLWRGAADAPRREVLVRMGEATLIFSDSRSEAVISHWSLPAVRRVSAPNEPALYAPGDDSDESVEIEDADMIAALKTVQGSSRAATPREGRLRARLLAAGAVAALVAALVILPGFIKSQTAAAIPNAKRAEIGQTALDDLTLLTGMPCAGQLGLPALAKLSERIFGPENTPILYILPDGLKQPAHLPGGAILLPKSLLETDSPEALAGAALAEYEAAKASDPLRDVLDHAGLFASFNLLTSGDLEPGAIKGYGATLLREDHASAPQADLVAAFSAANVPLTPYAQWLDPAGENGKALIAADPLQGKTSPPLLPDDDWIALQSVCSS